MAAHSLRHSDQSFVDWVNSGSLAVSAALLVGELNSFKGARSLFVYLIEIQYQMMNIHIDWYFIFPSTSAGETCTQRSIVKTFLMAGYPSHFCRLDQGHSAKAHF